MQWVIRLIVMSIITSLFQGWHPGNGNLLVNQGRSWNWFTPVWGCNGIYGKLIKRCCWIPTWKCPRVFLFFPQRGVIPEVLVSTWRRPWKDLQALQRFSRNGSMSCLLLLYTFGLKTELCQRQDHDIAQNSTQWVAGYKKNNIDVFFPRFVVSFVHRVFFVSQWRQSKNSLAKWQLENNPEKILDFLPSN